MENCHHLFEKKVHCLLFSTISWRQYISVSSFTGILVFHHGFCRHLEGASPKKVSFSDPRQPVVDICILATKSQIGFQQISCSVLEPRPVSGGRGVQGGGNLRHRFLICQSIRDISVMQSAYIRSIESGSYLTGVTTAKLRWHLPTMNAIFNK